MSRVVVKTYKSVLIFAILLSAILFVGNATFSYSENIGSTKIDTTKSDQVSTADRRLDYKIQQKIDAESQQITPKTIEQSIDTIDDDPVNIVDNLLKKTSKKLNIAIVAPMTGKYKSIGSTIVESAMLTVHDSKYMDSGTINVYNIEQLSEKNWQKDKEVQRLVKDDNDVIIGFIFNDTARKLLSITSPDKPFINFTNNNSMTKEYPNLIALSMNDGFKIISLLKYLSANNRQFLSLILPVTKKGYLIDKLFRKIAPQYKVFIVNSQFYQKKNKTSIASSVQMLLKSFKASYTVNENGNLSTETYQANKARLKNTQEQQDVMSTSKTMLAETNAIYIEADETDLTTTLSNLDKNGILDKNIQIFSDAIFDPSQSSATNFDSVLFLGYDYQFVNTFNKKFKSYFDRMPNYFAYMTYDIVSMLLYVANTHQMLPRYFFSGDGFHGILDDFRFTRSGKTERRLGIYKLKNQTISKIYTPSSYSSIVK